MARYDYGVEKRIYVPGLDEQDVDKLVQELVEQAREVNAAIPNHGRALWMQNQHSLFNQ